MNEDSERIFDWLNTKKLVLKTSNTKWMLLTKSNNNNNLSITENQIECTNNDI